jgi:hypothetical protein
VEISVKNPPQIGANTNSSADLLEQETLEDVSGIAPGRSSIEMR